MRVLFKLKADAGAQCGADALATGSNRISTQGIEPEAGEVFTCVKMFAAACGAGVWFSGHVPDEVYWQ